MYLLLITSIMMITTTSINAASNSNDHKTPALAVQSMSSVTPSRLFLPYGFLDERLKAAAFLQGRFDERMGLLKGVWAGGHGYEPLGYSLIDVNFFAQFSLGPYNATMAKLIATALDGYLQIANYSGDDRRENMFGKLVSEIWTVDTVTVEGGYPAPPHAFWMVTEKVNRTGYTPNTSSYGVNAGVTMALSRYRAGDNATAVEIMSKIASWWNASTLCVMEPAAFASGFCYTRALSYFLFGVRALRLPTLLPRADMIAIETQLWRCQVVNCSVPCGTGKAISSTYAFGGEPMRTTAHSSTEPSNLALLAYDDRITTQWFPLAKAK
eukprot:m.75054 g.75054  ORF g.75054 m.75054 type:complete len:325 (-) comp24731_c0_seq1:94-1068(-)